jgi:putative ABC transport system permease protein
MFTSSRVVVRELPRDLKFAVRAATRRPAFSATVVLTLALAIGAPTAVFSVVHAVLLRPLPYPEADRLVRFSMAGQTRRGPVAFDAMPAATALRWGRESRTLAGMALFNERALTLSSDAGPFRLTGISATPNLFDVLGVTPLLGRGFDAASHDTKVVVLSHDTWERHFGGNGSIVDSTIVLDGERYLVAGVMPRGLAFPSVDTAFWVPLLVEEGGTRGMLLPAVARLAPGADLAGVLQEGTAAIDADGGMGDDEVRLTAATLQDQMVGGVRRLLWVLMTAVAVVFVIGCTNIALLLMTRGTSRDREFSIRLALGVSRTRLAAQLVSEVLVLAVLGGAAGVLLANLVVAALKRLAPAGIPRLEEASLDANVLILSIVLIVLTTIVFGVLAAGRGLTSDPARTLGRLGGESLAGGRSTRRPLNALAACQLALTMVLLVAAGLLLRSFVARAIVDQGFRPGGAVAMQVNLPASRYPSPAARVAFHERLLDRVRQLGGIDAAGFITMMPNRQASARFVFSAAPLPEPFDPRNAPVYEVRTASEGFLEAMGVPLIAGRTFKSADREGEEPVVVISQRLAREQFGQRSPVGELLYSGRVNYRVIGVVADVRPAGQDADPRAAAYLPFRQDEGVFQWFATATLVVRSDDLTTVATSMRALVLSMDSEMPPFNVRTLSDEVSRMVAGPRFSAGAVGVFAFAALVMAALGVYGVMAYTGGLRTREIGVRMALGATRNAVVRLILRDGLLVVGSGLVLGGAAALWLARGLTGLLHEVAPADPLSLFAVGALLSAVGIVAVYVPARRATRIAVTEALRIE